MGERMKMKPQVTAGAWDSMTTNTLFILESVLFEGVALGFGVWQFWSVRPSKTKTEQTSPLPRTLKEGAGHPEGQHGSDQGRAKSVE
jgi:hypothetical protein